MENIIDEIMELLEPVRVVPHNCSTQCDRCHTMENCVEATRRFDDLLLCDECHAAARSEHNAWLSELSNP